MDDVLHTNMGSNGLANIGTDEMPGKSDETLESSISIVFSDIDGTLIHYPGHTDEEQPSTSQILKLPPSSTGMKAIISHKTLAKCEELRQRGVKLVLVSGMRTSTLLNRIPFLPRADAYCSEAGGRIFYPVEDEETTHMNGPRFNLEPFDGAQNLRPFGLKEDMEWRQRMNASNAAGKDGYLGNELEGKGDPIPIAERDGRLWEFARKLLSEGYVIDSSGYATCFRVNRKQQSNSLGDGMFDALLNDRSMIPAELASSVNLGCIDCYPTASGKKNCCEYLAKKLITEDNKSYASDLLSSRCTCMCDDDNDLEMAMACMHAFIPSVSSVTMEKMIESHPEHFTITGGGHESAAIERTWATEAALESILDRLEG